VSTKNEPTTMKEPRRSRIKVDFNDDSVQTYMKVVDIKNANWDTLIRTFKRYTTLSDSTVADYEREFTFFVLYCEANGIKHPVDVNKVVALSYRRWLLKCVLVDKTYSLRTGRKKIAAAASMFAAFQNLGMLHQNPFHDVRFPTLETSKKDEQMPIEDWLFEKILDYHFDKQQVKPSRSNERNIAILYFARATGLRNSAIRTLTFKDISLEENDGERHLTIRYTNKGATRINQKDSETYLGEGEAFKYFMAWCEIRRKQLIQDGIEKVDKLLIFPSYYAKLQNPGGKLLTSQRLNKIVTEPLDYFIEVEGLDINRKSLTFHSLRHAFATEVARNEGLESASKALGHKSTNTTQIYASQAIKEQEQEKARDRARRGTEDRRSIEG